MNKIFILTMATLLLVGCGGGGSSSGSSSESGAIVGPSDDSELVVSEPEIVYPGNKVVKNSEDTLIQISHTDGTDTSTIVLLQGSATIIRNP